MKNGRKPRHGMADTPIHRCWTAMRHRCRNPNNRSYPNYGGRGIKVCARWEIFENFFADMGQKPSKEYSIGRIDNDGNYEPGNCRWEKPIEQQQNTRANVVERGLEQVARDSGISISTIRKRHADGKPLTAPLKGNGPKLKIEQVREIKKLLALGEPVKSVAQKFGMGDATIYHIRCGRAWKDA